MVTNILSLMHEIRILPEMPQVTFPHITRGSEISVPFERVSFEALQ